MNFLDKVVLVTGASSGIGASIAIEFAKKGAKVAIIGRKQYKLNIVAKKCGQSLVIVADVSKDEDCKRIINETIAHFGKLDVLVNNAGIVANAFINAKDAMQVFDQVMNTNLRSAVHLTHLAAPHLIETRGSIINISSISSTKIVSKGGFSYNCSKAAMDHFTRSVALDLASSGVRVNTVNPGPVRTDCLKNAGMSEADEAVVWNELKKFTALGRLSQPEEVADLVLFLASEKAIAITGSTFSTDNGMALTGGTKRVANI